MPVDAGRGVRPWRLNIDAAVATLRVAVNAPRPLVFPNHALQALQQRANLPPPE